MRKHSRLKWTGVVALAVGLGFTGCSEDNEHTSPAAPSPMLTATAQPTGDGAEAARGPTRTTGNGSASWTDSNASDTDEGFVIASELLPGTTRAQLEAAAARRNAGSSMARNAASNAISRPGRVNITRSGHEWRDGVAHIQVQWSISPAPSGPFLIEVDQYPGGLVHRDQVGAGHVSYAYGYNNVKGANITPGWYGVWIAAQNCSGGRCRSGGWRVAIVQVKPDPTPPRRTQWPQPTITEIASTSRPWFRNASGLCGIALKLTADWEVPPQLYWHGTLFVPNDEFSPGNYHFIVRRVQSNNLRTGIWSRWKRHRVRIPSPIPNCGGRPPQSSRRNRCARGSAHAAHPGVAATLQELVVWNPRRTGVPDRCE